MAYRGSAGLGINPLVISAITSATSRLTQPQAQAPAQIPASPPTPRYASPTTPDDTLLIAGIFGGLAIIGLIAVMSRRR